MASLEQRARDISRPLLEALGRALARAHIAPNRVTAAGLVITIAAGVLAGLGFLLWAALVYATGALCDALDGSLARVSGRSSRFGAFLDSTLDRFEEAILFLGLTVYYARQGSVWEPPLILAAIASSLMVSYTRARAEGLGVDCRVGMMQRAERLVLLFAGTLIGLAFRVYDPALTVAMVLIALVSNVTAIQRLAYVRAWEKRKTDGQA